MCPIIGALLLKKNKFCNVIYYHDIVEGTGYSFMQMNIEHFKQQMLYLKRKGYETLRFDDLDDPAKFKFRKKRIVIGFDDGWKSNYAIFGWMKEQDIKYNIYLTMGEIGNNPDYLTWNQVREMHSSGICGFGAHTFTHPDMSDLSKIDIAKEITEANELFHRELGYEPVDFCYPFGYYSEKTNEYLCANTGYKRIYTSKNLYSYAQGNATIMGRNGISDDDNQSTFINKLKGYENCFYSFERKVLHR